MNKTTAAMILTGAMATHSLPDYELVPDGPHAICPDCGGNGWRYLHTATGYDRPPAYKPQPHDCATCKGDGELTGYRATRVQVSTVATFTPSPRLDLAVRLLRNADRKRLKRDRLMRQRLARRAAKN